MKGQKDFKGGAASGQGADMDKAFSQDSQKSLSSMLGKLIHLCFGLMMAGVLFICLFLQYIDYGRKGIEYEYDYIPNNILAVVLGGAAIVLIYLLLHRFLDKRSSKHESLFFVCLSLLLFLLQIKLVFSYYFFTDWDVNVLTRLYILKAESGPHVDAVIADYFSTYPNNLFLQWMLLMVSEIPSMLGIAGREYEAILIFLCLINQLTCMLTFFLSRRIFGRRSLAWLSWILTFFLVGLSPWTSIPYSDSVGLIFPMLFAFILYGLDAEESSGVTGAEGTFAGSGRFGSCENSACFERFKCFSKCRLHRTFMIVLLGLLAAMSYAVKPQAFIIVIAAMLIKLTDTAEDIKNHKRHKFKTLIFAIILAAFGFFCGMQLCDRAGQSLGIEVDEEGTFGLTHYIMLGLNDREMGVYDQEDYDISHNAADREERREANLRTTAERLKRMGPVGLIKLFVRKTLTNFNDGNFCWGGEGVFYFKMRESDGGFIDELTRDIYYNQTMEGRYYKYYDFICQSVWMGVLLLCALNMLPDKKEGCFGRAVQAKSSEGISASGSLSQADISCLSSKPYKGFAGHDSKADMNLRISSVLLLSLIGLTIFETIFEARARYLYIYVPVFCMAAVMGLDKLMKRGHLND